MPEVGQLDILCGVENACTNNVSKFNRFKAITKIWKFHRLTLEITVIDDFAKVRKPL